MHTLGSDAQTEENTCEEKRHGDAPSSERAVPRKHRNIPTEESDCRSVANKRACLCEHGAIQDNSLLLLVFLCPVPSVTFPRRVDQSTHSLFDGRSSSADVRAECCCFGC